MVLYYGYGIVVIHPYICGGWWLYLLLCEGGVGASILDHVIVRLRITDSSDVSNNVEAFNN
jgi:hypothetical protein